MSEPNDRQASTRHAGHAGHDRIDEAAQDWFLLLRSGEATGTDRARFQTWRDADPRHRRAYDELCDLWADIDDLRGAFAAPGMPSRQGPRGGNSAAAIATRPRGPVRRRRQGVWAGLMAACVALLLIAGPDMATRIIADHRTGVGEQARVDLADGSVAWLNTDTAITVDYAAGHRRVSLLRGEAQFEVAKDPDRPFAVLSRKGRSRALGTIFTVRDQGPGATVTVSQGMVEVTSPVARDDTPAPASHRMLSAGEQVRYSEGATPGPVRRVNPKSSTAWRKGFIAIKDLPLADALVEIDRYRPGRIVLLAGTTDLETVTARLSIRAVDNGLEALAATHGLTVTRLTDYLVLVR